MFQPITILQQCVVASAAIGRRIVLLRSVVIPARQTWQITIHLPSRRIAIHSTVVDNIVTDTLSRRQLFRYVTVLSVMLRFNQLLRYPPSRRIAIHSTGDDNIVTDTLSR